MVTRRVLVDVSGPVRMSVVEGKDSGSLVVEGKIGHCDVPTANGRVYPRSIMEREIKRLAPRIEQASVYAAVDHPGDGKTRLKDSGAIVRGLWVEPNGEIHGKFEVVEDAPAGQAIAAFLRKGASVGMSSRGLGSTTAGPNGHDVVGEDFRLNTWDFVSDPACHDAYPAIMSEDEEEKITEDHLRARFPEIVKAIEEKAYSTAQAVCEDVERDEIRVEIEKQAEEALKIASEKIREDVKVEVYDEVRTQLREDFATKLVRAIAEMRDQITEEVKSDLSSDPTIAGAKITLQKISEMLNPFKPAVDVKTMLDEKDGASADLQKKIIALESATKKRVAALESEVAKKDEQTQKLTREHHRMAFALYVEQKVSGHPAATEIKKLINLREITSAKELEQKVTAALSQFDKARVAVETEAGEEIASIKADYERKLKTERSESDRSKRLLGDIVSRVESIEASFKKVIEEKDAEIARAKNSIADGEDKLSEALEQSERAELIAYGLQRTVGHKHANKIMRLISEGKIDNREEINSLASKLEEGAQESGGVRERVRRGMSRGRETMTEDERKSTDLVEANDLQESGEAASELRSLGMSLNEAVTLTGNVRPARR